MTELFIVMLNLSLTGGFAALAVCLVRLLLKKAPKIYSLALWLLVFFRFICPFTIETAMSLMPVQARAIPQTIIYSANPSIASGIPALDNSLNTIIGAALPSVNQASSVTPLGVVLGVSAYLWAFVASALILYAVFAYIKLAYRLRTTTKYRERGKNQAEVFECDRIKTAFVFGFFRPRIYIPANLSERELAYILDHEQVHIKRLDYLFKPIAYLVCCIHFYNPLAWLSYILMTKDMELSADEAVIKRSKQDIRQEYSNSLLMISTLQSGFLTPLAFGETGIKTRIKNVLSYKAPAVWVSVVSAVIICAVFFAFSSSPPDVTPPEGNPSSSVSDVPSILPDEPNPGSQADAQNTLRLQYYDFAVKYRLDYVPLFYDEAPTDATEFLYWAFAVNFDKWGQDKGIMTKEYVESSIRAHFEPTEIIHASMPRSWDFDGAKYTAVPMGIKEPPITVMRELSVAQKDGQEVYTLTVDFCTPVSGNIPGFAELDAIRAGIESGDYSLIASTDTDVFTYYLKNGEPIFLSHSKLYGQRDPQIGVNVEMLDIVNYSDGFIQVDGDSVEKDGYIFGNLTDSEINNFDGRTTLPDQLIYRAIVYYKAAIEMYS